MSEITNPQDAELEEVVLGACLLESKAITLVAGILRPEVFYTETNREIYAALQSMYHAGQVIDIMTIKEKFARRGKLEFIGGVLYKLNNRYAIFMPKQVTRQTSWLPILE
ncbi:replicative DNA helicase [Bacteroides xylanisolvens]|nr:replicative DNA helicase [Bacteroides xylanisolvens]